MPDVLCSDNYTEPVDISDDSPINQLRQSGMIDYVWSFFGTILIMSFFVIQSPARLTHWMLVPLAICGTIVGADAIRWFSGKYTLFDPMGIIGIYGINFFVIAPLLIVIHQMEGIETYFVTNWPPLLGRMAILNAVGLIIYKLFQRIAFNRPSKVERTYWSLNMGKALIFIPVFFAVAFISLCIFVLRGGGMSALILQEGQNEGIASLQGFGIIMILKDALPMTTLIMLTVFVRMKHFREASKMWLFVITGILVLFFITSGLRGSRAATALGLICAGGVIHYFWRRITVPMVLLSLIPLGLFFYFYGFYKSAGIIGIRELVRGQTSVASLQERTTRTFVGMLIGDMSRAPVQAVAIDVLVNKPWEYRYRYGKTYPLALGYLIPRQIWKTKPTDMGRIVAGTELLYGPGSHGPLVKYGGGGNRSTQLYGLAGEAMLNFGIYGVPVAFAVWGYVVGRIRRRVYTFRPGDLRLIMSGFWLLFSFVILMADADQYVWFFVSLYVIPATLTFLIADKIKIEPAN